MERTFERDLFDHSMHAESAAQAIYPFVPSEGKTDTSAGGADRIKPHCGRLQKLVLGVVASAGASGATTDEIAAALNVDRPSVQPRTSELKLMGLIVDSKERRKNASGVRAIVWTVPADPEAAL